MGDDRMRYASETNVSSEKSKAEIEATLRRYGADQFGSMWQEGKAAIQFRIKNKMVRFILPLPSTDDFKMVLKWGKEREASPEEAAINWEKSCRQRWRALALAIKAKLEAVECGITTFEEEFLAHIVIPGQHGKTMGQLMIDRIEESYETGKAPQLGWEG